MKKIKYEKERIEEGGEEGGRAPSFRDGQSEWIRFD